MSKAKCVLIFFVVLYGFGCSTTDQIIKNATVEEVGVLKGHVVEAIRFDLSAKCKIGIKSKTIRRSGRCGILLTSDNRMKFTIDSPFGGAVVISYMDKNFIQLLDRQKKTFSHIENNEKNRRNIFIGLLNLKVEEFREILWGRDIKTLHTGLEFRFENRRPVLIRKFSGSQQLSITYLKWQEVWGIAMPRTILMEDRSQNASITIALTHIVLGVVGEKEKLSLLKGCDLPL